MRPDRVALVLGDVDGGASLAGEDVEVVEPEVDHHFLQLSLAVNRAQNSGSLQLGDDPLGTLQPVFAIVFLNHLAILFVVEWIAGWRSLIVFGWLGALWKHATRLELPQELSGLGIFRVQLRRRHVQDGQVFDFIFSDRVRDLLGIELLANVVIQADCLYAFDVTRTRAKAKPVKNVDNALFFGQ